MPFNVPIALTWLRIVMIPVFVAVYYVPDTWLMPVAKNWTAMVLFAAAAITDWLDGYLARRLNQGSALGRMLDPIADKLLVNVLLIALAFTHDLDGWDLIPAIAIMLRETFIPGLREFLGNTQVVLHVTQLAKWKTTAQLVALAVVIATPLFPWLALPADIVLWLAGALTVITGVQYFASAWPHLRDDPK